MAGKGGARPGAGRPKTKLSRTEAPLKKATAEEILASIDEVEKWQSLLSATNTISVAVSAGGEGERENISVPDWRVQLDAMKYLTDRRDGKPKQSMEVTDAGGIILNHAIPRPERNQSVQ